MSHDIIVTIPKKYDFTSKMVRQTSYWRISGWPKETEPGNHIYFVQHGEVQYKATISDSQPGFPTELDFENVEALPEPHQQMEGFQGWVYYNPKTGRFPIPGLFINMNKEK